MHYDTSLYSASCKEKISVDEAVFWSTVWDELKRKKIFFIKNIHSLPNLTYPISHNNSGILIRIFKLRLAVTLIFHEY